MAAGSVSTARGNDTYRRDIDGLRAIAVLSVVAFHAFPELLPGGFVGVDVFFVISGYLISGLISKQLAAGTFTFRNFYARRIRRILPALLVVLVACYVFGWITLLPGEYGQLSKHIAAGMGFVSNFALWNDAGYFDASASAKPLLHLWSLGIEEQFYLLWPLALWWFARMRRSSLSLIVAVGVVSFAINIATRHTSPVADFYSPLSRFWELQAGCLLAYLTQDEDPVRNAMRARVASAISIAGAFALGLSVALFNPALPFPGWWAVIPTGGTFLLIASGPGGWFARHVLSRTWLVWIGLVSYPLYLWHWPILSFASIVENGTPSVPVRLAAVFASGVLALTTYVFVEKPIRFGSPGRFKVPALALLSLVVGIIGYATYERGGLPSRFPLEVREIASFGTNYEYKTDARYPDCWLSGSQPFDGFAPFCANGVEGRNRMVIWGDSHAARLYPGLKLALGDTVELSQFTRDGCAPILGDSYATCQKSNDWIITKIGSLKPKTVVLFADWTHSAHDWRVPSPAKSGLLATIDALRKLGVAEIVVIGPAPRWKVGLPKLAYEAWKQATPFHRIPERLANGLDPIVTAADQQMRIELRGQPVKYASLMEILCTDAGCLTHTPQGSSHLITWDQAHLTTDGAFLVARQLIERGVLSSAQFSGTEALSRRDRPYGAKVISSALRTTQK